MSKVQTLNTPIYSSSMGTATSLTTDAISYRFFGPTRELCGKRVIFVIVDSASQWPEIIATDNLEAKTICEALFNNVVNRFGIPRSISVVSDNDSGFASALAETIAKTYDIKQHLPSP
jgi:hypothetical protein